MSIDAAEVARVEAWLAERGLSGLYLLEVRERWRPGRGRWWRPDRANYTDRLMLAGLYTEQEMSACLSETTRGRPLATVLAQELHEVGSLPGSLGARLAEAGVAIPVDAPQADPRAVLYRAVQYVLDRAQTDPDLGYQVGPGTEAFRLLCAAEAAHTGSDAAVVETERGRDLQPEHRRRRPRVVELEELLDLLDRYRPTCDACGGVLDCDDLRGERERCASCRDEEGA